MFVEVRGALRGNCGLAGYARVARRPGMPTPGAGGLAGRWLACLRGLERPPPLEPRRARAPEADVSAATGTPGREENAACFAVPRYTGGALSRGSRTARMQPMPSSAPSSCRVPARRAEAREEPEERSDAKEQKSGGWERWRPILRLTAAGWGTLDSVALLVPQATLQMPLNPLSDTELCRIVIALTFQQNRLMVIGYFNQLKTTFFCFATDLP